MPFYASLSISAFLSILIANHEIVVTSDSAGITIMPFKDFKSNMDTHFAMNIAVTKKDYSQVLIYKSTLHFTTIFSDLILLKC